MLFEPRKSTLDFVDGDHRLVGDLTLPPGDGPFPAIVTVQGSGSGGRHLYDWAERFTGAGFGCFMYDRPGSGESTGDYLSMDFDDRARETLAAVAAVGAHPQVDETRIALFGGSQGGWVAPLAATRSDRVAAVVTMSGPAVSPASQEEYRIGLLLAGAGLSPADAEQGVAALRAAYDDLRAGRTATLEEGRPWSAILADQLGDESEQGFLRRILDYDPLPALRELRCPFLAVFGAADAMVRADESARLTDETLVLASHSDHLVVTFPAADHGIRPLDAAGSPAAHGHRAPGFFELVTAWLARRLP